MIHLVIPGPPPTKNSSRRTFVAPGQTVGRSILSKRARTWRAHLLDAWIASGQAGIATGTWCLHVRVFHSRRRTPKSLPGTDGTVADIDCDAALESIADALEHCGCLDNDARIVALTATKHWCKDKPRTEIKLEPWESK
jgi:Holliday junction resolvase RusA-like endonuclease